MIEVMTTTEPGTGQDTTHVDPTTAAAAATAAARAASQARAAQQVRHAAARWLTSDRLAVLGPHLVSSINRYQQTHSQGPTWADAVAGVDPAQLAPIQYIPDGWPYRPALFRRELRQHLMMELRRTRWITYTTAPRSLQAGDQGRGWLRSQTNIPGR
jgi:hypothetical protein